MLAIAMLVLTRVYWFSPAKSEWKEVVTCRNPEINPSCILATHLTHLKPKV